MLFGGAIGPPSETLICEGTLPPLRKVEGFAELVSPSLKVSEGPLPLLRKVEGFAELVSLPLIVCEGRFGVATLILGVSNLVGIPVIEMDFPNALPGVARVRIALLKALSLIFPDNAFSDS